MNQSTQKITIRPFKKSDLEEIQSLVYYHLNHTFKKYFSDTIIKYMLLYHDPMNILKDVEEGLVLCALFKNEIIGTISLNGNYVNRLYVHHKYQNQGIGTALMNKIFEIARNKSLQNLVLDSFVFTAGFYKRFGFTITDKRTDEFEGDYLEYYRMEKELNI